MEGNMRKMRSDRGAFYRRWPLFIVFAVLMAAFTLVVVEAESDIILTVVGPRNTPSISYTGLRIKALPQNSFSTFDQWDRKHRRYTGVGVLTLLEDIGYASDSSQVEVISRNNHRVSIDLSDIRRYGHIFSYRMDDSDYADIPEDNKGPVAIAVKTDNLGERERQRISDQVVWWIEKIIVR